MVAMALSHYIKALPVPTRPDMVGPFAQQPTLLLETDRRFYRLEVVQDLFGMLILKATFGGKYSRRCATSALASGDLSSQTRCHACFCKNLL